MYFLSHANAKSAMSSHSMRLLLIAIAHLGVVIGNTCEPLPQLPDVARKLFVHDVVYKRRCRIARPFPPPVLDRLHYVLKHYNTGSDSSTHSEAA